MDFRNLLCGLSATRKKGIGDAGNQKADSLCAAAFKNAGRLVWLIAHLFDDISHSGEGLFADQISTIDDARNCGCSDSGLTRDIRKRGMGIASRHFVWSDGPIIDICCDCFRYDQVSAKVSFRGTKSKTAPALILFQTTGLR